MNGLLSLDFLPIKLVKHLLGDLLLPQPLEKKKEEEEVKEERKKKRGEIERGHKERRSKWEKQEGGVMEE